MFIPPRIHRKIYFFSLVVLVLTINWSPWMMGFMVGELILVWLVQPSLWRGVKAVFVRPTILLFSSLFIISCLWLLGTTNMGEAVRLLEILFPILAFAIVIGTLKPVSKSQFEWILLAYIASTVASTFFNLGHFAANLTPMTDIRELSFFMSHIRYSLFINLAIFFSFYLLHYQKVEQAYKRYLLKFSILWLTFFLFVLQSMTGIVVFIVLAFGTLWLLFTKRANNWFRFTILTISLVITTYVVFVVVSSLHSFYPIKQIDVRGLKATTKYGNPYFNDVTNYTVENGNHVYIYFCDMELAEAWNKRSSFPYNGNNKNGYYLPQTLVRYMASKGLTKDRDGMSQMTDEDVRNVENGVTNYRYTSRFSLKKRVYEIIWELHMYFNGANPSGFSISQRIEFLKCALSVIESNELWGVGTGDIREEMNRGYQVINSKLEDRHFLPHNQYVTIMVRFGFVGLMLFMTCFIFSIILEKKHKDYLVVVYLVTVLVSMLNEDTLETQYGIIFFAFWGALLVFGYRGSSSPQHPSEVIYERENDDTRVLISRKND